MKYFLEERTLQFSKKAISVARKYKITPITSPLINQFVRSATSIGANYREANGASSKKDFKNKIFICKKESKEAAYWLEILMETDNNVINESKVLFNEVRQFILLFSKIAANTNV